MSPQAGTAVKAQVPPANLMGVADILALETEWALRVQLAAAYRMCRHYGWDALINIYGHLTVRVPGPERHFLINPYGLRYDEVTASNLVKIDLDGNPVEPSPHGVNPAGFVIHGAIHADAPDAHCVIHTHTRAGMTVAAMECGLLPISMAAMSFTGVGTHDYEGSVVGADEKARLVRNLGPHKALVLKNHGLLTVGKTIPEAFIYMWRLESACQVQVDAMAAGAKLATPSAAVAAKSAAEMNMLSPDEEDKIGVLPFAASMRLMDQIDPGYRN